MKTKRQTRTFIYNDPMHDKGERLRLDSYVTSHLQEHSRSSLRKSVDQGLLEIEVNGKQISKMGHILRDGDVVVVHVYERHHEPDIKNRIELDIIARTDDFLIINKPAGLLVHKVPTSDEPSLVNGLPHRFHEKSNFSDQDRPGIVHRLDKDTSGLIIVARHPQAQRELSSFFKERLIDKTYLAVVHGHPDRSGIIDLPVGRHRSIRHKMSHVSYKPRHARTDYEVLAYYNDAALVAAHPVTGRTHQIRVHFAALGHGIIGDKIYGKASRFIDRQALHAWKLHFVYKGQAYSYTCPLPSDMRFLVQKLHHRDV